MLISDNLNKALAINDYLHFTEKNQENSKNFPI